MHELAITRSLLQTALDAAANAGAGRIRRINLRIGQMTGYVPEAVEMNFGMLSAGTRAEGAVLDIRPVPLTCRCRACGHSYQATPDDFSCRSCRAADFAITGGREMFIESLEVDG